MNALPASGLVTFLERFVLPLVTGGELHVGEPITDDEVAHWELDFMSASQAAGAIDDARAQVAAQLVVRPPPMLFGPVELRLAAALYNALVLAHPRAEGWFVRKGRKQVASLSAALAALPPPETRADLLGRHGLLHNLCNLSRVDTKLHWWTGTAEFRGSLPPKRLTRWKSVRRVREEHTEIALGDFVPDETRDVIMKLVAASPLTDLLSLLTPARRFAAFRWSAQPAVLRERELCRAVAYRWLAEVLADPAGNGDPAVLLRAPGGATGAWETALSGGLPSDDLRAITAFLVHLSTLVALAEVDPKRSGPPAESRLVAAALAVKTGPDSQRVTAGTALFFAVPDIAAAVDPAFASPPGLAEDPALRARWEMHRGQVRAGVPEDRLAKLTHKLQAVLAG